MFERRQYMSFQYMCWSMIDAFSSSSSTDEAGTPLGTYVNIVAAVKVTWLLWEDATDSEKEKHLKCWRDSYTSESDIIPKKGSGETKYVSSLSSLFCLKEGVGSAMDQCEDREDRVPSSETNLCREHGSQTTAQRWDENSNCSWLKSLYRHNSNSKLTVGVLLKPRAAAHTRLP